MRRLLLIFYAIMIIGVMLWEWEDIVIQQHIKEVKEREEREKQEAEERRIQKRKIRTEWREKHAAERAAVCEQISKLSSEDQLRYICEPDRYAPGYYGIDFSAISDDDLLALPSELLTAILSSYPTLKDNEWRSFRKRVKQILQSKTEKT